jgi:hypothetical protein
MSYAHQRAEIMYQWIKRNLADKLDFDLKINQITLTLPEELHELDQKVFAKMIKSFMKLQDIEAFGYVIQTRHSENPLDKKYHHAHVLTLNIKKNNRTLIQNDYYFDLGIMRRNWKNTIEKFAKISIEGNVNLHNEYASILKQKPIVMHLLAYVYRYSIQDLFEVQVRAHSINYLEFSQFEGALPSSHILQIEEIGVKVSEILNEAKNNFVWCGLLSSIRREELKGLISGYSSQLDLEGNEITPIYYDWQTLEQIKKEIFERAKTCRDCGFLYEELPFERGFYNGDDESF